MNTVTDPSLCISKNGIKVSCPGLFSGELIVLFENSHQSMLVAMKSTAQNFEPFKSVFQALVNSHYQQCIFR